MSENISENKIEKKKSLWSRAVHAAFSTLYRMRVRIEDRKTGGIPTTGLIPSRFGDKGAFATQSADFRGLDRMFKVVRLHGDDVFVDVGCGKGRVLTYLHRRRLCGSIYGVELDPDIADIAKARTENCRDIQVICGNILDQKEIVSKATAFFLFNPFNDAVLAEFVDMIESLCDHEVRLYYCFDCFRGCIDGRANWKLLARERMKRKGGNLLPFSIYAFEPPKKDG